MQVSMIAPTQADVIEKIDRFLALHAMRPSRFGTLSVNQPGFVASIRAGRSLRLDTFRRVLAFMDGFTGHVVDPVNAAHATSTVDATPCSDERAA